VPRSPSIVVAVALLVSACSNPSTPNPSASAGPAESSAASPSAAASGSGAVLGSPVAAVKLTVGLGYIPSVQFAAFYRADQAGYYTAEGLQVSFQNEIDANLVPKVGGGQVDIGLADGTSVIPAVSQGIPIKYFATVYGRFPSIVFAKQSSGIATAADLKGKKIGIPGKYGSSWIMLQALLASVQLTTSDVTIVEYPDFGQGAAVAAGAVDAATGFANNEPVQLQLAGTKINVLTIDQITPLPGPGLIASTSTITDKSAALAGFVRATMKAMNEIAATPSVGVDASIQAVPDLAKDRPTQEAILAATIATWPAPDAAAGARLTGAINVAGWQASIEYLTTLKLVAKPVTTNDVVDLSFTSGSGS
jgi:NitT/TauT family transport system substrate-binding protein